MIGDYFPVLENKHDGKMCDGKTARRTDGDIIVSGEKDLEHGLSGYLNGMPRGVTGDRAFVRVMTQNSHRFRSALDDLNKLSSPSAMRLLAWAAMFNANMVFRQIAPRCRDVSAVAFHGCAPLHLAAARGHVEAVHMLLSLGANVNVTTSARQTALHLAVDNKHEEVVQVLVIARADLDAPDAEGKTALHYVLERELGDGVELATFLINQGANAHLEDLDGITPTQLSLDNVDLMAHILNCGATPSDELVCRYIEECAACDRRKCVLELLVNGWCPLLRGGRPCPARRDLISGDSLQLQSVMVKVVGTKDTEAKSAPPREDGGTNTFDFSGGKALLHKAAAKDDVQGAKGLIQAGGELGVRCGRWGWTPLHVAANRGHMRVMEMLIASCAGADAWRSLPTSTDTRGRTPLHLAAHSGSALVVKLLLAAKVDFSLADAGGQTPMMAAVKEQHTSVVEALITAGDSPCPCREMGETPLHVACRNDDGPTVAVLLRAGAVPGHSCNFMLRSPLHVACESGSINAIRVLLPCLPRRHINFRDRVRGSGGEEEGGDTALTLAVRCRRNEVEIIEALLSAGADVDVRSASSNATPLVMALNDKVIAGDARVGPRLIRTLVGNDIDVVDPDGYTPLHRACKHGACGKVVEALLESGANPLTPCAGCRFLSPAQLVGLGGNTGAMQVIFGLPQCGGVDALGPEPECSSALACAVEKGRTDGVRFLLEEGADIDLYPFPRQSNEKVERSMVHLALEHGHGDIVCLLVQAVRWKNASHVCEDMSR